MKTIFKRVDQKYELLATDCLAFWDIFDARHKKVKILVDYFFEQGSCSRIGKIDAADSIVLWKWNCGRRGFKSSNKTEVCLTKENYQQLLKQSGLIVEFQPLYLIVLQSNGFKKTYEFQLKYGLLQDEFRMVKCYQYESICEGVIMIILLFWIPNKIKKLIKQVFQ